MLAKVEQPTPRGLEDTSITSILCIFGAIPICPHMVVKGGVAKVMATIAKSKCGNIKLLRVYSFQ